MVTTRFDHFLDNVHPAQPPLDIPVTVEDAADSKVYIPKDHVWYYGDPIEGRPMPDANDLPGYDHQLNPDAPTPSKAWAFKAARNDIDVTRILRESYEAGSEEVRMDVGAQTYYFLRADVFLHARSKGFVGYRGTGIPFDGYTTHWSGARMALNPVQEPLVGPGWYVSDQAFLGKIKRWLHRPIEVRVQGF